MPRVPMSMAPVGRIRNRRHLNLFLHFGGQGVDGFDQLIQLCLNAVEQIEGNRNGEADLSDNRYPCFQASSLLKIVVKVQKHPVKDVHWMLLLLR